MTPSATSSGIGVGIGDQRILAAEFQHHRFERVGRRLHHRAAGRHRADQRDHGDAGMGRQRGAGLAAARHDVEHARRQNIADQFGKPQRRQRRLFRRLHHHGVAGRQRRAAFAGAEHERMVERNDAADDAARLAHREIDHVRAHRDRRAFHFGHEAGVEFDLRRGDRGVAHHLGIGIAAIGGVDHRQFLGVLAQHIGDALEQARTLERRRVAPGRERGLGRIHRGVDIGGAAIGHRPERLGRSGIDGVGAAAGDRLVPLAAVKGVAVLRQIERLRLQGLERDCFVHGVLLTKPARAGSHYFCLMSSRPPKRATSVLAPIASTNSTMRMAYMRGMSNLV